MNGKLLFYDISNFSKIRINLLLILINK